MPKAVNAFQFKSVKLNYSFPPEYRLRSSADFSCMRQGKRMQANGLLCIFRRNEYQHARLGMAVSKKYGNAVQRQWLKRRIRETFRCHDIRHQAIDIMIIPKLNHQQISEPMVHLQQLFYRVSNKVNTDV